MLCSKNVCKMTKLWKKSAQLEGTDLPKNESK